MSWKPDMYSEVYSSLASATAVRGALVVSLFTCACANFDSDGLGPADGGPGGSEGGWPSGHDAQLDGTGAGQGDAEDASASASLGDVGTSTSDGDPSTTEVGGVTGGGDESDGDTSDVEASVSSGGDSQDTSTSGADESSTEDSTSASDVGSDTDAGSEGEVSEAESHGDEGWEGSELDGDGGGDGGGDACNPFVCIDDNPEGKHAGTRALGTSEHMIRFRHEAPLRVWAIEVYFGEDNRPSRAHSVYSYVEIGHIGPEISTSSFVPTDEPGWYRAEHDEVLELEAHERYWFSWEADVGMDLPVTTGGTQRSIGWWASGSFISRNYPTMMRVICCE